MQEKGEFGFNDQIALTAQGQEAEFDAAVDPREYLLPVLEVEQADEPLLADNVLKVRLGGVVGGNAARHDQAGAPPRIEEVEKRLREYGVGVEIASSGQREPPSRSGELAYSLCFPLRGLELPVQVLIRRRRIVAIQSPDETAPLRLVPSVGDHR